MIPKNAVFLDRDGVINELVYHKEAGIIDSPFSLKHFRIIKGAEKALRLFKKLGFLAVVVSNQPGIAKGHFSKKDLDEMTGKMNAFFKSRKLSLDGVYYCLHHPESKKASLRKNCSCRKPKPGLLKKAAKDLAISLKGSYMIGDSWVDIKAGKKAGCKTIMLVDRHKAEVAKLLACKKVLPDFYAKDLSDAAVIIKNMER